MEPYLSWLLLVGIALFAAAYLPDLLEGQPISYAMVYVGIGAVAFGLPLGLDDPDPLQHQQLAERVAELVVIVSLMGGGIRLDRRFSWKHWGTTWRILGFVMPLCVAAAAMAGWGALGLSPASAILLGAVLAPTDPVLASDVQVGPPMEGHEPRVRFALTSEAGLNDGMAMPFMQLAILAAGVSGADASELLGSWFLRDVLYAVPAGVIAGYVIGMLAGKLIFRPGIVARLQHSGGGIVALALAFVAYSLTQAIGGYGFLAVFVTAITVRACEPEHRFHRQIYATAETCQHIAVAVLLVLFGGAVATGLLSGLTWSSMLLGLAFLLIVRPLAGWIGLSGSCLPAGERFAIAFFGIRGIDSLYLLAFGLGEGPFPEQGLLWQLTGFVVLASILIHGVTAAPVMRRVEQREPA